MMKWFFYNLLFAVGYLLLLPRFLVRMCRRGGYRRGFLQRFALYNRETKNRLGEKPRYWIHAVSVGEVGVALRYAKELRREDPSTAFVLTTTTSTGHRVAEQKMHPDDVLLYFPADFPLIAARALSALRPLALILTECELWPNLIRRAKSAGVPVILINGRISESSYRGYRLLRTFARPLLQQMELLLVQTEADRDRLLDLGANASTIRVMGSAKYDVIQYDSHGSERAREILAKAGAGESDLILVGGSTWPGEEAILLDIVSDLLPKMPQLRLVLVPRHAERSGEVEQAIRERGMSYVRRSRIDEDGGKKDCRALLVDTTGELAYFYAVASVIFVGKSLTAHGGQNIIEPAFFGKPVVVGPNVENFPVVLSDFLKEEAMRQVSSREELAECLEELLTDPDLRNAYGARARGVVEARRGIVARSIPLMRDALSRREC